MELGGEVRGDTEKELAGAELWLNKHSKWGFICQTVSSRSL